MTIGYVLNGPDNGSFMYDRDDPRLRTCPRCGHVTDHSYVNPKLRVVRRQYDVSYTYDGHCVVSLKFREFCIRFGYAGVEFRSLPCDEDFFLFDVGNVAKVDIERKQYHYEDLCDECGQYESVTPATPIILKDMVNPLPDGFFSTDGPSCSGDDYSPFILVGTETKRRIEREKMKGIYFEAF